MSSIHFSCSVDWILFVKKPVTMKLNYNEVEGVQWVSPTALRQMFTDARAEKERDAASGAKSTETITPWFELISNKLLFGWWEQLETILEQGGLGEKEARTIHRLSFADLS